MRRMKKWVCMFCAVCLMAAVWASFPKTASAIAAFEEATIIADDVNMRLRPTVDSPFVLKLKLGTRVGVFCEEVDGWCRIIYGNYRGYVSKDYVFLPSTDTMVGNILVDACPVTHTAGDYAEAVATLSAGTGITIIDMQGEFYSIRMDDGTEGFVKSTNLKVSSAKTASNLLKKGMKGAEVTKMQNKLRERGFLDSSSTGEFGDKTLAAVTAFQEAAGLSADGIAGAGTLEALYSNSNIVRTAAARAGLEGKVQLTPWSEAQDIFTEGTVALITDVKTGIQWEEERFGGWYHADCEPVSAEDTAKLKEAYGGEWSWDRRAIWVTIDGVTMAASMNGMPHLASPIEGNDFPGHHCIHFYKSMVHETSAECPRHQAMVQYAYKVGNSVDY